MKVAFATQDSQRVDAHFASARTFMLFDVLIDRYDLLESVRFESTSNEEGVHQEDGEDRLAAKLDALDGVALLFVRAIGGPAAARVVKRMVHPIKLPNDEPIPDVVARIQTMMRGTPPPWLRKIMQQNSTSRFADEEEIAGETA